MDSRIALIRSRHNELKKNGLISDLIEFIDEKDDCLDCYEKDNLKYDECEYSSTSENVSEFENYFGI